MKKIELISVLAPLCKVVRFQQSECRKCEEICPEKAITVGVEPQINAGCSCCGLCVNVCPTETFSSTPDIDKLLAKEIASLFVTKDETSTNRSISFHCSEAQSANAKSLGLHCLGNFTENSYLRGLLLGFKEMLFITGNCSKCRLSEGRKLFDNLIIKMQPLVEAVASDEFLIQVLEKPKNNSDGSIDSSRRKLFTRFLKHLDAPSEGVEQSRDRGELFALSSQMMNQKRLSPKQQSLRELLIDKAQSAISNEIDIGDAPWKRMMINQANCTACGICEVVCPTGALTKIQSQEQVVITVNYAQCSNCLLCQEACPQHIISFTETMGLAEIIENQAIEVVQINLTSCIICGDLITPAEGGEICLTCSKRQMTKIFAIQ